MAATWPPQAGSVRPVRYLSPEWIDAAGRALAGDAGLKDATVDVQLTLEQVVTGGPAGTVRWTIAIDHGRVEVVEVLEGAAPAADLRFTTTYDTAAGIASGSLGAQRAFAEGRLRVGGDLSLLVAHHRTLASVDDALAPLRAETSF
jgi:putative sterol carrier protein